MRAGTLQVCDVKALLVVDGKVHKEQDIECEHEYQQECYQKLRVCYV